MQEGSFIPEVGVPNEFASFVGYFVGEISDAAVLGKEMLEAIEGMLGSARGNMTITPSLSTQRLPEVDGPHSFWKKDRVRGVLLVREERSRPVAELKTTLMQAPTDASTVRIGWSRRRNEEPSHFPLWYLAIEQSEPVDEDDDEDDYITVGSVHVRRDLLTDPVTVIELARHLLRLWHPRGCYHAIIDLAPEPDTRGGFCYHFQRYRPVVWPRLVADELWRSLGAKRRSAVRVSYWGTYLNRGIIACLGDGFNDEFRQWPKEDADREKSQSWTGIGDGALLLLSDNIFDVSEFGLKGNNDPSPMWEGADDHCAELAAWLRLRLQQVGVIVV